MKKILMAVLFCILTSFVLGAGELNYTSLGITGYSTTRGYIYYFYGENPILTSIYENDDNINLLCSKDALTCYMETDGTLSGNCLDTEPNSSSPISLSIDYTTLTDNEYLIYCQLCNNTGYCDNSTFSGNNYVSFRISNLGAFQTFLTWLIAIIGLCVGLLAILNYIGDKKVFSNTKGFIITAIFIVIGIGIAMLILQYLIYGF